MDIGNPMEKNKHTRLARYIRFTFDEYKKLEEDEVRSKRSAQELLKNCLLLPWSHRTSDDRRRTRQTLHANTKDRQQHQPNRKASEQWIRSWVRTRTRNGPSSTHRSPSMDDR